MELALLIVGIINIWLICAIFNIEGCIKKMKNIVESIEEINLDILNCLENLDNK